jgi:hypothetical protein
MKDLFSLGGNIYEANFTEISAQEILTRALEFTESGSYNAVTL